MKKGRITNGIQRVLIFGCVAMMMVGLVFTSGDFSVAEEIYGKTEICTLQSVTLTVPTDVNAESVTITGGLQPIVVDKNVNWSDYFANRSIESVSFIEDTACTAKGQENHSYVAAYLFGPTDSETVRNNMWTINRQKTEEGYWYEWMCTTPYAVNGLNYVSSDDLFLDESVGYYEVKFEPRFGMIDGVSPTGIYVRFAKEYNITYNLDGGVLAKGAPTTYIAGTEITLPTPTKEGYIFTGWTGEGVTIPTKQVMVQENATGDHSYTANWAKVIDIAACDIALNGGDIYTYTGAEIKPALVVKNGDSILVEGTDYTVTYSNNVSVADKNATNAPTITITGMGNNKGSKVITYTIKKATPSVVTLPTASAIEEGQKLSDSVLTGGKAVDAQNYEIKGTFAWKEGSVSPAVADSESTKYKVTFTPTDTVNYETVETDVVITVNKKAEPQPGIVVGDEVSDKDKKATYKVTQSAEDKVEVSYVAPAKKNKKVTIPATVTLSDGTTAKVTSIAAKAFKGDNKIQEITIGKNVKTIGKEAFSGCKNLKKVKSVTNVTSIGKSAFANCKNLKNVTMGSKVTTLGEKAFYKCTKLTQITIPKNVKSIGKSAFQGCSKLKNISIKTTKLTKKNVKKNAFKGIHSKAKFNVPNSKVTDYKKILKSRGASENVTVE